MRDHIRFLIAFDADIVLIDKFVLVSFVHGFLIVEGNEAGLDHSIAAHQIHVHPGQISFELAGRREKQTHGSLVRTAVESIARGGLEVAGVGIWKVVQRMYAAYLPIRAPAEFQVKVRICGIVISDASEPPAALDFGARFYALRNFRKMEIEHVQVDSIRILRLDHHMTGGSPAGSTLSSAEHRTGAHGVDGGEQRSGQIDTVVKIPAVPVDAWSEGRVHLVGSPAVAQWPDELRHRRYLTTSVCVCPQSEWCTGRACTNQCHPRQLHEIDLLDGLNRVHTVQDFVLAHNGAFLHYPSVA